LLLTLAMAALTLASCGDDGEEESDAGSDETTAADDETATTDDEAADDDEAAAASGEPVTIEWWHIQNNDPGLSLWQAMADEFMEMHPNVTIEITVLENDTFKPTIDTRLQANDPPDLFQSWGGGGLQEQVDAGLLQDITEPSSAFIGDLNPAGAELYNIDGVQYGVPYNLGMVGFWYNKDLFAEAGIEETPTTWDGLLETVQQLKDAGITPMAVGAGAQWPAHFYYAYLLLRVGGPDAMTQLAADGDFSQPPFIEAGNELQRLLDLEPFQDGYLAAPWPGPDGEAGYMATGQAAMDLMGQWAPGEFDNSSPDGEIGFELGWFPFPSVDGGAGAQTDVFGGADGIVVGRDAPPEAVEFLQYITSLEQANRWGETGTTLPVTIGSDGSVTDPNQQMVLAGINEATFFQLYLDQLFAQEVADTVNAEVQRFFGGESTSEELGEAITAVAQSG
jgi:raffinose/stachyose/melibiose transport system substrate-binding protein